MNVSRRAFLATASAAAVAVALPPAGAIAASSPIPPIAPAMPMWAVGTEDGWDWRPIAAPDAETARRYWVAETFGGERCESVENGGIKKADCDCDWCSSYRETAADRKPAWDGKDVLIGDEHWLNGGMGAYCARCCNESWQVYGAQHFNGETVCDACLTIEDWDKIDPVQAAEMRDELRQEELES